MFSFILRINGKCEEMKKKNIYHKKKKRRSRTRTPFSPSLLSPNT